MSTLVVFRRSGVDVPFAFGELGRTADGAWGVVDGARWTAAPDGANVALLYLSLQEYEHAVRGLPSDEVREVVEQRRRTFAAQVPASALGHVAERVRRAICARDDDAKGTALRAELIACLGTFTVASRFVGATPLVLIEYLRQGEAELIAELDSPSLRGAGEPDPGGDEHRTRRRFASELSALGAERGRPEMTGVLPFVDVERAYLLAPVVPALAERARMLRDPMLAWRGGLILPLSDREANELDGSGHSATAVFPARLEFMGALGDLTSAQLEVELAERIVSPGFAQYLQALRLQQATLRAVARTLTSADSELSALLDQQASEESSKLGAWLAVGVAPASKSWVEELADALATAAVVSAASVRLEREAIAQRVVAFSAAIRRAAEGAGH